jgi:branched-subunit amino acid transport protein
MDHDLYIWIGLLGLGLMTALTRSGVLLWPRPITLAPRLQRALRFAPMAAIAAVIVPSVLFHSGGAVVDLIHPKTLSAAACLLAWWLTRQMSACLLTGLAVYVVTTLALGV